jgi:hypothetical protein
MKLPDLSQHLTWLVLVLTLATGPINAQCPSDDAFQKWLMLGTSTDAIVKYSHAFLPPPPSTESVAPACVDTLMSQGDARTRAFLLGSIGEAPNSVATSAAEIANYLEDSSVQVSTQAALTLSRLGPEAVPTIVAHLLRSANNRPEFKIKFVRAGMYSEDHYRPWVLASMALERIGAPALSILVPIAESTQAFPLDIRLANHYALEPSLPSSSRSYIYDVIGHIDTPSLIRVYDSRSQTDLAGDRLALIGQLMKLKPNQLRSVLSTHPELIPSYITGYASYDPAVVTLLSSSAQVELLRILPAQTDWEITHVLDTMLSAKPNEYAGRYAHLLLTKIIDKTGYDKELYLRLLLEHDIKPFSYEELSSDLKVLGAQDSPLARISSWKALHDLGQGDIGIEVPLTAALVEIADKPDKAASVFIAVKALNAITKDRQLTLSSPLIANAQLTTAIEVSLCPKHPAQRLLTQLVEGRRSVYGPSLALGLMYQLQFCSSGSGWQIDPLDGKTRTDDEAGVFFWEMLDRLVSKPTFIALASAYSKREPVTIRKAIDKIVLEDLSAFVPNDLHSSDLGRKISAPLRAIPSYALEPEFLEDLRSLFRVSDADSQEEAASLMARLHVVRPDDVKFQTNRILTSDRDQDTLAAQGRVLLLLGQAGRDAILDIIIKHPESAAGLIMALEQIHDLAVTHVLVHCLESDRIDIRENALLVLLFNNESELVRQHLIRRPVDLRGYVNRALEQKDADTVVVALSASVSTVRLRNDALIVVSDRLLQQSNRHEIKYADLLFAAHLGSPGREAVSQYVTSGLESVRNSSFSALLKTTTSSLQVRSMIELLRAGSPFVHTNEGLYFDCPSGVEVVKGEACPDWGKNVSITGADLERLSSSSKTPVTEIAKWILSSALGNLVLSDQWQKPHQFALVLWALSNTQATLTSDGDTSLSSRVVAAVLNSDCYQCQEAIEAYLETVPASHQITVAIGTMLYTPKYLNEYVASVSRQIGQLERGFDSRLEPLPVYGPSDRTELSNPVFQTWHNYDQAYKGLKRALLEHGFDRYGLFAAGDGFAVTTGLMKINQDGTPNRDPKQLYSVDDVPEVKTVGDYFGKLFLGQKGTYRLVVLICSGSLPSINRKGLLGMDEARSLFKHGELDLPIAMDRISTARKHYYAFVYDFQRSEGTVTQENTTLLSASQIVARMGIFDDGGH